MAAAIMIPFYIVLWIAVMGGFSRAMDDDSYPGSIVMLPVVAAIFSGFAFWIAIFPLAHAAKWVGNRWRLSTRNAGVIAIGIPGLLGGIFGILGGGVSAAMAFSAFLVSGAAAFWLTTTKKDAEPGAAPTP